MFERFTERARRAIILAQEEAKRLNHDTVGSEHILLGIIREGRGIANKVLESLTINPERVCAEIETAIGRGEAVQGAVIPFTPKAKKVLEMALGEARKLKHNYIGTEHLLLGLIREGEVAARVLQAMGADLERARSQVVHILGEDVKGLRVVPHTGKPGALASEEYETVHTHVDAGVKIVQEIRELELQKQFWRFTALVLAGVGLALAALFFRH